MEQKRSELFMNSFFKRYLFALGLCLILVLGLFLRFYKLNEFPVGFHLDEAIINVNAYFILLTGKDTNNNFLPLQTEMFGDVNPTGYSYLSILPIKIFGLNEFAARFPGALLGGLTIIALFLFTYAVFQNKRIGLISSFLVAISPWSIVISRSSEEALVASFFVILGYALVGYSFLCKHSLLYLFLGVITLCLSFLMYFTSRVFVPLIFPIFLFLFIRYWKDKNQKYKYILFSSFFVLIFFSAFLSFSNGGDNRFHQVSIFGFPETRLVMEEQIREDGVMGIGTSITRIFHNKIINYLLTYLSNYSDYFSINFLFIKGGLPLWLNISGMGLIYLLELPFFIVGIIGLIKSKENKDKFPLFWILMAPLTAAITFDETPNVRRSLLMFPMIELVSAYGFYYFLRKRKYLVKILVSIGVGLILIYNFAYFMHQYFVHEKVHRTWYRNNGVSQMIKEIKEVYDKYDKIIVSKSTVSYPLLLFYMKYDPLSYLNEGHPKDKEYQGFGKFFFVPQTCPVVERNNRFPKAKKVIYINNRECEESGLSKFHDILREDGTKAFRIIYD